MVHPDEAPLVGSDDSDGCQTPSEMPAASVGMVNACPPWRGEFPAVFACSLQLKFLRLNKIVQLRNEY